MTSKERTPSEGPQPQCRLTAGDRFWKALQLAAILLALTCSILGLMREMSTHRLAAGASDEARKALEQANFAVLSSATAIDVPAAGELIEEVPYDDMTGRLLAEVPAGYGLRVVARDAYSYYLMNPVPVAIAAAKTWSQTNVRLGSPGTWHLMLCLADRDALAWFDDRVRRGDWSGFPTLPPVTRVLAAVSVMKTGDRPSQPEGQTSTTQVPPRATPAVSVAIELPRGGERITRVPYDDMKGTLVGSLLAGYSLRVLAKDSYNYFLMYPSVQLVATTGRWTQTNVRLSSSGRWLLCVCVADAAASAWLDKRASQADWSGFPALPDGLVVLQSVEVVKE